MTITAAKNGAASERTLEVVVVAVVAVAAKVKVKVGAEAVVVVLKQKEGQKGGHTTQQSPVMVIVRGSLGRLFGR